ncbi:MAG: cytochrome c-type biogenesis protein CcmH, partial [Burkholderiales bacterium]|nr:cytochrome c-type biogenesis protein CcmH [Burkholderiales bacterium]
MRIFGAWLLVLFSSICLAQEAPSATDDPVLEKRVKALSEELRCLVCQNQSLADSNADLAVDLRNRVREMMQSGKSDEEIRQFMVERYGDFVLYSPPIKMATLVLWVGPFVLLIAAAFAMLLYVRHRQRRLPSPSLTDEERERARALLSE